MDITKLKPINLSPFAREKVILDFFPEIANKIELFSNDENFNSKSAPLHAGALCLYATTLITKLHETSPLELEPYYKERADALKVQIKNHPKFKHLTDDEIVNFVQNTIKKDIRNCFAHGNFGISYDTNTKRLFYVLHPQRKDFVCHEPIIISKNSLLSANKKFLNKLGKRFMFYSDEMLQNLLNRNFNKTLKSFMLPTQMLKLSDYYLGGKKAPYKSQVLYDEKLYYLIDYVLLSTKITYEQDDYYNIFGKNSNIFDTISLIRNSLAHDNYEFVDLAHKVNYVDKDRSLSETVGESAIKLLIVDTQKQIINNLKNKHSADSINDLAERFTEIFDFFFGGKYDLKDIVDTMNEIQDESQENQ